MLFKKYKTIVFITLSLMILPARLIVSESSAANNQHRCVTGNNPKRVALIIGNSNYQFIQKLKNPVNDVEDLAKEFQCFGFEVIEKKDLGKEAMDTALAEFGLKLDKSEASLFYYSGHGVQVNNQNYLIPVDAKIQSEAQIPYKTINVNQVLDELDKAKTPVNIVMLDACRNNPLTGQFRSFRRGLATPGNAPQGTVIVYATAPGEESYDGNGRNGLFTSGLLTALREGDDLSLDGVLTKASEEVEKLSVAKYDKKQVPYVNGPKTVQKSFKFAITVGPDSKEVEMKYWDNIKASSDPEDFQVYLKEYPKGIFAGLARNRLKRLQSSSPLPAEITKPELIKAPQSAGYSIEILEGWQKWQNEMDQAYSKTEKFQGLTDLQIKAWELFLGSYQAENPYTEKDNELRQQAQAKLQNLKQTVAQKPKKQPQTPVPSVANSNSDQLIHGRYRDHGDGTVTDIVTNIRWKRCAEGETWNGNTHACDGKAIPYTWNNLPKPNNSWRVPTFAELKTLLYCSNTGTFGKRCDEYEGDFRKPAIDQEVFPIKSNGFWFWSSSAHAFYSDYAWYIDFNYGDADDDVKSGAKLVRVARAGQ